ncbi:hypothetical protein ABZ608_25185 [Streptomyces sp. NPDC013172]|uniref:Rv1733c family protein n=1 Tax=Streptomyces sp. NPDC013172 TaxID=3155009 RepID=UPI00340F13BF
MRTIRGLWRWRRNPLRRATDLVEAWLALVTLVLIAVAAPVLGSVVGAAAQGALQRSVRQQHHDRHLVTVTVVRRLGGGTPVETDPDVAGVRDSRSRVLADWTAPDGSHRQGSVLTTLKSPDKGDHFDVWTDQHGLITARPLDSATASTHAVLAGFGAALLAAGLVEGARRMIVWRMVHRRYARWDQAWERAGPDWGKAGTGS